MNPFLYAILEFWYTIAVVFILGRFLYYPNNGKREYLFTFILLAAMVALICMLVNRVGISVGFAIGIFALFGIIRYRTTPISPREMTYIFLSAGIAAKNTLAPEDLEAFKILSTDFSLILLAAVLEFTLFRNKQTVKPIVYNNLELIHPERRKELEEDLYRRYGISRIEKIKVGKIDAVKNSVQLRVHFIDRDNNNFSEN
jgi:hypothetical protein